MISSEGGFGYLYMVVVSLDREGIVRVGGFINIDIGLADWSMIDWLVMDLQIDIELAWDWLLIGEIFMTLLTGNGSMDFEGLADLQWIGITIRWIVNGWMCWQIGMGLGDNDRIDMQFADWYGIGNMLPLGGTGIW